MIGYYVHHQGRGHLHRAQTLATELGEEVVGLSSLPPPEGWRDRWVRLERDDAGAAPIDPTARGRLHWTPVGDIGLSRRMRRISEWLDENAPRLLVVDVSVEVALLARLQGVRPVVVMQPGRRDDPAHLLGYDVADRLVAFWPASATESLLPGLPDSVLARVEAVGALSRFPVIEPTPRRPGRPRAVVLSGAGGQDVSTDLLPDWDWTLLGTSSWHSDPRSLLADADVVVTHAGQNAVAEVAALRRPAVVVPQDRPHDEQRVTARLLHSGSWPVAAGLAGAAGLDGSRWAAWCDGMAARRFAEVVAR
jgi:hypothetical protein